MTDNMVFTLGLRHTFPLLQRGLALLQFLVVQTSFASFRAVSKKISVVRSRWYNSGMTTIHEILTAAQSLPSTERAQLIAALWDNVSPADWVPPDAQWVNEANRRSDAYDAGEMTGAPWAEVRERARRKAGLDG